MNKKGNLFSLIHSMTKSEKRYFKRYSQLQKPDSNLVRLFDTMDKAKTFDEIDLNGSFQDEVSDKGLIVLKRNLQLLILKVLRNYHDKISVEAEIHHLILNIEILWKKGLFDLCEANILKAKQLATKHESHHSLVIISDWERRLVLSKYGPGDGRLSKVIAEQHAATTGVQEISKYWTLLAETAGFSNSREESQSFQQKSVVAHDEKTGSIKAEILKNHVLFSQHMVKGELSKSELYVDKIIHILESHPEKVSEDPEQYATSLGNKATILLFQKRWKEAAELFQTLRDIPNNYKLRRKEDFSVRTICRSYNLELEMYRDKKDAEKGIELLNSVKIFLETHAKAIPKDYHILFWFQFANIYFSKKEYSKSLEWVNRILEERPGERSGILVYARILHLILHYEVGNIMFIQYAIDSHRRFLKKYKLSGKISQYLLSFFKKLTNIPETEKPQLFELLRQFIEEKNQPMDAFNSQDYVDILGWATEKLQHKTTSSQKAIS